MARPGRSEGTSEDTSVPIWLKLSAVDSAKMDQVLARPEFEGWTKGEWCLEIIQTALRYYTKPRPAGEPGRKRAPGARAAEPSPPQAETEPVATESAPPARRPGPPRRTPQSRRPTEPEQRQVRRTSRAKPPVPPEPEPRQQEPPRPEPRRPEPRQQEPRRNRPDSGRLGQERVDPARTGPDAFRPEPVNPEPADLGELASVGDPETSVSETECSHPAEARDYQSGTCAACGAILWD